MKPRFINRIAALSPLSHSTIIIVCASLCAAASANAASGTWIGTTSGSDWSNTANWAIGIVADGAGNTANFSTIDLPAAAFAVILDTNRTVGNLTFGDTDAVTTPGTWALEGAATTLTLSAAAPTITTGTDTSIATVIAGTAGLTKAGSAGLTLSASNLFDGSLAVNAGDLTLTETNAYTGGTTIGDGATLVLATNASFNTGGIGTGTVEFTGGTLSHGYGGNNTLLYGNVMNIAAGQTGNIVTPNRFEMPGAVTGGGTLNLTINTNIGRADFRNNFSDFSGALNLDGSGTMRFRINQGGAAFNGAGLANTTLSLEGGLSTQIVTNSGGNTVLIGTLSSTSETASLGGGTAGPANYEVGSLAADSSFAGGIRGNAILSKTGGATLTLTNNTLLDYTGATNVNEGILMFNGTKTGGGSTTVIDFATLAGTGTLAGTTTIASTAVLSPGDPAVDSGIGNLTFANLSLSSGSILNLEFASANDTATVQSGGTLSLASGIEVDVNGFNTDGVYSIINTAGATISGIPSATLSVINHDSGKAYTFSSDAGGVKLTISSSDPNNFWNVDGDGSWGTAANWTKNLVPDAPEASARIGPGVGGAGGFFNPFFLTIDLDAVRTIGEIVMSDDFGTSFTIAPGTSGSILMDNANLGSVIAVAGGDHFITAPVAVDAEGVTVDVADLLTLEISGEVSSSVSGGGISKSGPGALALTGVNTYDGGTTLMDGVLEINSDASLGDLSSSVTFDGGALGILSDITHTRPYQLSGVNSAIIDTNGFAYVYDGTISPSGGGTGGLTKVDGGTLTLSTPQSYTGNTLVNGGIVDLSIGASITGGALGITKDGGGQVVLNGGSLTSGLASNIGTGTAGLLIADGSASFDAGLFSNDNGFSGRLIAVNGGTFSSSFLTMGRGGLNLPAEPAAGSTSDGLLVTGGTAQITGALSIGNNSSNTNSSVSARVDGGSLTVNGATLIGLNNSGRWSVLDVNGGTFTSTDEPTGVQVGNDRAGNALFLVRGTATATAERILLQQIAASTATSRVRVNGGTLYLGAGGIATNNNGGSGILDVQLDAGLLGATASWTGDAPISLNAGPVIIKAADAADSAFDITLAGPISGTGGFTKTGTGALTLGAANTFAGPIAVTEGTLNITGDASAAIGDITTAATTILGGNGNIGGNVTIAPDATHRLAVAEIEANQVTRVISGVLTLDAGNIVGLTAAVSPALGTYVLATATGGIAGTLTTIDYNGIIGTVDIVGNDLVLTVTGTSGYGSWATINVGGEAAGLDTDLDGVSNGVEYFLNAAAGFTANPGLDGTNTVSWTNGGNIPSGDYGTQFVVQTSGDLVNWTDIPESDPNLNNLAGSVSFTLTGAAKAFTRLKVTPN